MSGEPIREFEPDADRLAVIRECMENYDVGDPDDEWPNNIISRWAIVYGSGVIARRGVQIRHAVDPQELALCRALAGEAAAMMTGVDVGMGSESTDPFRDFFITANVDEPSPLTISAPLIRDKFSAPFFRRQRSLLSRSKKAACGGPTCRRTDQSPDRSISPRGRR